MTEAVQQTASTVPENCVILDVNTTIPCDNSHNLISLEAEFLLDRVKATVLIPILFLVGFPANYINMVVFFKQGLKERLNLCIFFVSPTFDHGMPSMPGYLNGFNNAACPPSLASNGKITRQTKKSSRKPACPA